MPSFEPKTGVPAVKVPPDGDSGVDRVARMPRGPAPDGDPDGGSDGNRVAQVPLPGRLPDRDNYVTWRYPA